jgi:hypothetical protein
MHSPCSRCLLRWSYVRKEEHRLKIPSSSVFVCVNGDGLFLNHHFTHRQLTRRLIKRLRKEREKKRDSFRHVVTRAFLFAIMTHRTVSSQNHQHRTPTDAETIKEQVPMQIFLRHPSMTTCHIYHSNRISVQYNH